MAQKLDLNKLLPSALKNETLTSLVSNLFNRFVSEEQSVFIAGRIGKKDATSGEANIQAPDLEHELNAMVPVLYLKSGTEEQVFSFSDFLNKLKALSADVDYIKNWMAEESFNLAPPIDFDKFVNYANYYWLGNLESAPAKLRATWNPELNPEYYVIKRPAVDDTKKYPVRLATTRNIRLHGADRLKVTDDYEVFTGTFISPTEFILTGNQGSILARRASDAVEIDPSVPSNALALNGNTPGDTTEFLVFSPQFGTDINYNFGLEDSSLQNDPLLNFSITVGTVPFMAGDTFTIKIKYFTSEVYVSFSAADNNPTGRGTIDRVFSTAELMFVDGQQIRDGDRILVIHQNDASENGIYRASGQKWERVYDASTDAFLPVGSLVYVNEGITNGGNTYILSSKGSVLQPNGFYDMTFTLHQIGVPNFINQWQEFNFWYHRDFIINDLGLSIDSLTQAIRPIIEYDANMQLNEYVDADGNPCDSSEPSAVYVQQIKTRFNQLPQFDLYYYDGTHAKKTSSIFFYVEDQAYPIDNVLQRRAKITPNADYVFGIGITDEKNRLLFFKNDGLQAIWAPGPSSPSIGQINLNNTPTTALVVTNIASDADNQKWTITCIDGTNFSVYGERHGTITTDDPPLYAQVGNAFITDDFTFTILPGTYVAGDTFTFFIRNKVSPRYVKKLDDGSIVNYPGGAGNIPPPENDRLDNGIQTGVWLTPIRMFQNLKREFLTEVNFADLTNHFRSIIKNQDGFIGSSFGINNFRNLNVDRGFGGQIREFGSNFPLLLSMLAQRDLSPLSILDFAEAAYNLAIASADQMIFDDLARFIATTAAIPITAADASNAGILRLLEALENSRATDENLKLVFSDTTAKIANWPVTLPMIGLVDRVVPEIGFDFELGVDVITHHDGHKTPIAVDDVEFNSRLVRTIVPRSDGTTSPGIFKAGTPPVPPAYIPYARQVWMETDSRQLYVFDVISDADTPPDAGNAGEFWFKRSTQTLYEWDTVNNSWVVSTVPLLMVWKPFNVSAIRNSLILAIEQRLFDSVHPVQASLGPVINLNSIIGDPASVDEQEVELAKFAAKYTYDVYGTDYNQADAFTWNYSQANFPGVAPATARWFDIYKQYFDQPGLSLPTCRPNIEPWKLLNHPTKPSGWDATYACQVVPNALLQVADVRVVAETDIGLSGLQTIDGVTLANGDRVLVTAQTSSFANGIYVASAGLWTRSSDSIVNGTSIYVTEGATRKRTTWVVTTADPITLNVTPLTLEQARLWSDTMWSDIKSLRPGLKLCVNPYNDELIPPYVSVTDLAASPEALINAIPPGIADRYVFGQNGPTEIVWKKSLEYSYGLARSYFKRNPLEFLDKSWGETYVQQRDKTDAMAVPTGVKLERNLVNTLPHTKFLMHGDLLHNINQLTAEEVERRFIFNQPLQWTGATTIEFRVGYVADNLTVFDVYVDGIFIQSIQEQVPFTIIAPKATVSGYIDDMGIPFSLGDILTISFKDDIVDPTYTPPDLDPLSQGCEGCVVPGGAPTVPMVQVQPEFSFVPARAKKFLGLGQLFTNLLRYSYIDTDYSFASNAYNSWDVRLAHRFGALVRQDSLRVNTDLGILPMTAYNILLKKSTNVNSRWISAIRIQLVEMGQKVLNDFGNWVPRADGADWIFRVEVYNPQHPTIDYYTFNQAGAYETFFALQKATTPLEWKRYTEKTALIENAAMPMMITGVQNVINLLYGYITRLEELGFYINQSEYIVTDEETGRNLDWQLEVEKFIDRVFSGISAGEGHILNPFMKVLWLSTPLGILAPYTERNFNDIYVTQAAYDVTGTVVPTQKLTVIRTDDHAATYSETPLFSAHLFTDEYEHVILFNNYISGEANSQSVFIPFLGLALNSAYLTYIRNEDLDRKPTFNGFFLNGHDVKRNIVSSVDLVGKYYDASRTFDEAVTARHATALLGFSKKDYFDKINITDASQFNFWRALIQAKGTNMTIDAFVNYKKFNDAAVDEYWAYKIATYGDARERTLPELKLNPSDCAQRFTQLQFYSAPDGNDTPFDKIELYTAIENSDDTRWFSIDDLGRGLKFEAQHISEIISATTPGYYRLANIYHNGDAAAATVSPAGAELVSSNLLKVTVPGVYTINGFTWLNPSKFSPVKLFDYVNQVMVKEISLWHPAIGIHAHEPLEAIDIIKSYDPARYNYSVKTTENANYQVLKPWAQREVGQVWWDTSNLGYIPYYDASVFPNRQDRQERWGSLAEWATIDLYEWVESSVPPREYDDKAKQEEGRADIPAQIKASGKAARKQFYKRDRIIKVRPIAWSKAAVGDALAHPAFGPAEYGTAWVTGNVIYADSGPVGDSNLIEGRRFGAWDVVNEKPIGELLLGADISYNIGSSSALDNPVMHDDSLDVTISILEIPNNIFSAHLGKITLAPKIVDSVYEVRISDEDDNYEDIEIEAWDGPIGEVRFINFSDFGLRLKLIKNTPNLITETALIGYITDPINDIYVREGISYTTIISVPDTQQKFINDPADPDYNTVEYEWRTWSMPTQDDLSSDLLYPKNAWRPYLGDWVNISATSEVVKDMQAAASMLKMKDGTQINKYDVSWTKWEQLETVKVEKISDGVNYIEFSKNEFIADPIELVNLNRLQLFVNGVQLTPNTKYGYSVAFDPVQNQEIVQVVNIQPEGSSVLLVYLKYQPTEEELEFDPEVEEDYEIQVQYKADYQYTMIEMRDENGNISGTKYYFWVENKNIAAPGKRVSIAHAESILKSGPSTFMLFSKMVPVTGTSAYFDSCALAGLGRFVTKNNMYKLRFIRDFTLRDDPEQLKLKNIHAEWVLLRRGQLSKIPEKLWNLLTDAAAGTDASGNPLPSPVRVDYDMRNGTRTRYGFEPGQIFADTNLVRASIVNAILNTQIKIKVGSKEIIDYITVLDFSKSDEWFADAEKSRETMALIWNTARAKQINEIFFSVLDDALANNYEFSDIFKTSFITVSSSTRIEQLEEAEIENAIF